MCPKVVKIAREHIALMKRSSTARESAIGSANDRFIMRVESYGLTGQSNALNINISCLLYTRRYFHVNIFVKSYIVLVIYFSYLIVKKILDPCITFGMSDTRRSDLSSVLLSTGIKIAYPIFLVDNFRQWHLLTRHFRTAKPGQT